MQRILIVDDNPVSLEYMQDVLQERNYQIHSAQNGLEAMDILAKEDYDLVVTDIIMESSGLELIRWIESNQNDLPVIAITGSLLAASGVTEDFCVAEVIIKPLQREDFLNKVDSSLRRRAHG